MEIEGRGCLKGKRCRNEEQEREEGGEREVERKRGAGRGVRGRKGVGAIGLEVERG